MLDSISHKSNTHENKQKTRKKKYLMGVLLATTTQRQINQLMSARFLPKVKVLGYLVQSSFLLIHEDKELMLA